MALGPSQARRLVRARFAPQVSRSDAPDGSVTTSRPPVIAVFTKNRTNPAYAAARLGAERTAARHWARVVHYVPQKPDNIEEQAALTEQAIKERPDAAVFVPVHVTAMHESVLKLNAARIPVVNILNRMDRG